MLRDVRDTEDAVVFIVSKGRNPAFRRVLWRVSVADAKRICSDPRTSGRSYMLVWTVEHIDDPDVNEFVPNGRPEHADVLRELGVTVLDSFELRERGRGHAA